MQISSKQYLEQHPDERKEVIKKVWQIIVQNLPEGFAEIISESGIAYVVPHEIYPSGYHCNPKQPLPFLDVRFQKNFLAVYHMGIYADDELLQWFKMEYPRYSKSKLDMGKSCIRFRNLNQIPFELLGELVNKVSVKDWIEKYEKMIKKN